VAQLQDRIKVLEGDTPLADLPGWGLDS